MKVWAFAIGIVSGSVIAFVSTSLYYEAMNRAEFVRLDRQMQDAWQRCDKAEEAALYIEAWKTAAWACVQINSQMVRNRPVLTSGSRGSTPASAPTQAYERASLPSSLASVGQAQRGYPASVNAPALHQIDPKTARMMELAGALHQGEAR